MANDNPFAVPDGRSRVRRNLEEAEQAATRDTGAPPAAAPTSQGNFFNKGKPTDAEKAAKQKGLIDAMRKRGDIASSDDDDNDDKSA